MAIEKRDKQMKPVFRGEISDATHHLGKVRIGKSKFRTLRDYDPDDVTFPGDQSPREKIRGVVEAGGGF